MAYRDSSIKRFEFSFDLFWKMLKANLETEAIKIASPKKVFRFCFEQKIINELEANLLLAMADDRNLTSHAYDEVMAEEISRKIRQYHDVMKTIAGRIETDHQTI